MSRLDSHSDGYSGRPSQSYLIHVCQYRTCLRSCSDSVLKRFQAYQSVNCQVMASGCLGQCGSGPMIHVMPDEIWYWRVSPDDVPEIIEQHIQQGQPVKRLLHPRLHPPSRS